MKLLYTIIFIFSVHISLSSQTANITPHDYKESSTEHRYTITASYPQVDFGPDALMGVRGIAQDVNNSVDTVIQNIINDFKKQVADLPKEPCAQQLSSLTVTYKTVYNNSVVFSFLFDVFSAPDCANHPYTYGVSHNYCITSTGAFKLADIFLPGSNYLSYISAYCIKELTARAKKDDLNNIDDMINQGSSPKDDNFRVFNVNKDSLTITFNPYRVGPWIWGSQSISIPLFGMKDMINPKGPLEYYFGK